LDVFPCEDGHAQERALLSQVAETIQAQDLWIADRNFCVLSFLLTLHQKSAFFIIRQHGNTPYKPLTELKFIKKSATGNVFEQTVEITAAGQTLSVRRVVVELEKPTRKGDHQLNLLTNLPSETVPATTVADLYRARWGIETAFQKLEGHLNSEINTLGYPKAALFGFCLALVAYNIYAIVMAALRATHHDQAINETVSEYYIAQEIATTTTGMLIVVPSTEWTLFAQANSAELASMLLNIAAFANLKKYKKNPRGPKKAPLEKTQFQGQPHVSTAKLLEAAAAKAKAKAKAT
jgi:hypothetical protein